MTPCSPANWKRKDKVPPARRTKNSGGYSDGAFCLIFHTPRAVIGCNQTKFPGGLGRLMMKPCRCLKRLRGFGFAVRYSARPMSAPRGPPGSALEEAGH